MTADEINTKIDITWAAVELYQQKGKLSIPDLIDATNKTASEIYSLFSTKKEILSYYYPSLILQYWAMIDEIQGFDSYSVSEKFSNFVYTLFDMMEENEAFVRDTFDAMILKRRTFSDFHEQVTELFKEFLTTDGEIAVSAGFLMNDYYYKLLTSQYLLLIKFWLKDKSEDKERTIALTDKLTGLLEEILYNKTLDKTFDLVKYSFGSLGIGRKIPFVGEMITDWFQDKEKSGEDDNE